MVCLKIYSILALAGILFLGNALIPSLADGNDPHKNRDKQSLTAPENNLYRDRCGGCHLSYPPGLLPTTSWRKILLGQSNHYGEDLALGQAERKALARYLEANAADKANDRISRKIVKSLGSQTPLRITEIPYLIRKHEDDDIPNGVFRRKSVGSFANCGACHPKAATGNFDKDDIRIPVQ